jgi:DNA-binding response OmpR family regulator
MSKDLLTPWISSSIPETKIDWMKTVLVIDDDVLLVRLIEHNLSQIGVQVLKAYSGYEGISQVRSQQPDLVILDIVLPDIDGWEVLQRIRQISKVPILMLSIKENEEDIVRALEQGADDYCAKPVGMKELAARVQAIFRRAELYRSQGQVEFADNLLRINLAEQRVFKDGEEVRLTPLEFNLLHYLLTNAGHFIKPREILGKVWGAEYVDDIDLLRTCVWQLRRKLEPDPTHPRYITNRPGFGYEFNRRSPSHA